MRKLYSENDLVNHYNLKPADRIVVPKSDFRIVQHHTLYLGHDELGQHWIYENVIGVGVTLTRVQDFFHANKVVTRINRFKGSDNERRNAVNRALQQVGKPYSLITFNCEHAVNVAVHNRAHSPQVANVFGLVLFFLAIGMLARGK